jgi:hypothetical protein
VLTGDRAACCCDIEDFGQLLLCVINVIVCRTARINGQFVPVHHSPKERLLMRKLRETARIERLHTFLLFMEGSKNSRQALQVAGVRSVTGPD